MEKEKLGVPSTGSVAAQCPFVLCSQGPSLGISRVFTCLAPSTTGTMHSGSVACVLSSMRMERNCILARRGSPAPTHVQQITSAFWDTETQGIRAGIWGGCRHLGWLSPVPHHQQLPLGRAFQRPVTLLISRGKLSSLILQLLQLLKLWHAEIKTKNFHLQPRPTLWDCSDF